MGAPFTRAALEQQVTRDWDAALFAYLSLRAASDTAPDDDAALDAYCEAMDALIERAPSPDVRGLALKVALAEERAEAFENILFNDHARGIVADIKRLAMSLPASGVAIDPHPQWLADRNRLNVIANQWAPMADGLMDDLIAAMADLELRIQSTPASTAQGWAAKAVLVLQQPSEGCEALDENVTSALREARQLLGIGHGGEAAGGGGNVSPWTIARTDLLAAEERMRLLPKEFTDQALDACGSGITAAIEAWLAVPARTSAEALERLHLLSADRPDIGSYLDRNDIDFASLIAEAARLGGAA